MADPTKTHRYVTIEQVVRAERPSTDDLPTLFKLWGLTDSAQEMFWVVAVDMTSQLKTVTEVAKGGFYDMVVLIPTVLAAALAAQTDRFIVAHNHPQGPALPSEEDIDLTIKIMAGANAAGMYFDDHIITGPNGWYSFYDAGLLTRAAEIGVKAATKSPRRKK